jgi:hypothetical protein
VDVDVQSSDEHGHVERLAQSGAPASNEGAPSPAAGLAWDWRKTNEACCLTRFERACCTSRRAFSSWRRSRPCALSYFNRIRSAAVSIGAIYWHFVDAVWLVPFFTFYITPRLGLG